LQQAKKRILIAEDDAAISQLLLRALMQEYDIVLAKDGHEAVAQATKAHPHLLLLDIMMPGMDGLAVARQVRSLPGLSNVPIIFLTAKDSPMDVIQGIQRGARHYLTKPFKLDDVRSKIKAILGK
jgi:DNA-binding response OmpR family regulator